MNKISAIEDEHFKEYKYLMKLFLSENSIETISFNAFSHLRKLEQLDLSYNRLEHLDENLFEYNEKLIDLNLSNNNFMSIQNRPLLNSQSIMYLHLRECKIPQLSEHLFFHLPNLRTLDLSGNLMITLAKEPFAHLRKLRFIDLHENKWQCDSTGVRTTIHWMKKRIASIQMENCFINPYKTKSKFEKMELDPNLGNVKRDREEVEIAKVWGRKSTSDYLASLSEKTCTYDTNSPESREVCDNFIECQKRYSELHHALVDKTEGRMRSSTSNNRMVAAVLLWGIFIGALFGSFATYSVMYLVRKCCEPKPQPSDEPRKQTMREMRREFRERNNFAHKLLTESSGASHTSSSLTPQQQSQIYSNHENTRQFLVNLFSKRQPRYLRNNSYLSEQHERYHHPRTFRTGSMPANCSPAPTSSSFVWEPAIQNDDNQERERMMDNVDENRESPAFSVWNNYYGFEDVRMASTPTGVYEILPSTSAPNGNGLVTESPPPPYAGLGNRLSHNEQ
ncbi:uncharacterized protein LOC129777216 isoform X2 [Toxorhynchites rutilus septentrionalis]|nr:uncharacterized protein LOC129777216 isoform X2 [Toxorhynchites rutilus septentrionalis]